MTPARGDVVRSSADRSIDQLKPAGRDRFGGLRAARGVNDKDGAGLHGDAEVAVHTDLTYLFVREYADDDDVGAVGDGGQLGHS